MFDQLAEKIDAVLAELNVHGYEGRRNKVLGLIQEARTALTESHGAVGPWETELLDFAEAAVKLNFLHAALVAVEKALDVSKLPEEEYEFGLNYGDRRGGFIAMVQKHPKSGARKQPALQRIAMKRGEIQKEMILNQEFVVSR